MNDDQLNHSRDRKDPRYQSLPKSKKTSRIRKGVNRSVTILHPCTPNTTQQFSKSLPRENQPSHFRFDDITLNHYIETGSLSRKEFDAEPLIGIIDKVRCRSWKGPLGKSMIETCSILDQLRNLKPAFSILLGAVTKHGP